MGAATTAGKVAAVATGLGGGLEVFGNVKAGEEAARATAYEQRQLEIQLGQLQLTEGEKQRVLKTQQQQYKTRAAQEETHRRENLVASIETIMALRAGRGVGEASPTGRAITDALISDEIGNIRTERVGYLGLADEADRARQISKKGVRVSEKQVALSRVRARRKAGYSLLSGYLGAGSAIAGGTYKAAVALS